MNESLFTKTVQTKSKTYYIDVRQAQAGNKSRYLQLTETRMHEGQRVRNTITIFPDQLEAFTQAFEVAVDKVTP